MVVELPPVIEAALWAIFCCTTGLSVFAAGPLVTWAVDEMGTAWKDLISQVGHGWPQEENTCGRCGCNAGNIVESGSRSVAIARECRVEVARHCDGDPLRDRASALLLPPKFASLP